jgi:ATP-dependent HslUV protease subunit HslV
METVSSDYIKGTTICAVKKDSMIAIAGDGQVTQGQNTILKGNAVKVRRIYENRVVVGFAGTVADAFTLSEKFEAMLNKYSGNLLRSAVELAQLWRSDKIMHKLEAMMIVADKSDFLIVSGSGDVIEPEEDGVAAIGSGGNYALAAAKALVKETNLNAKEIAYKALKIASEICVFTNDHITVEVL